MIPMRPLIEILEDERTLTHKQEALIRYLLRDDDPELVDILEAKLSVVKRDLAKTKNELREYMAELLDIQN
jgi:hypothetical protein